MFKSKEINLIAYDSLVDKVDDLRKEVLFTLQRAEEENEKRDLHAEEQFKLQQNKIVKQLVDLQTQINNTFILIQKEQELFRMSAENQGVKGRNELSESIKPFLKLGERILDKIEREQVSNEVASNRSSGLNVKELRN